MRIRSITYFLDPGRPLAILRMVEARRQLEKARAALALRHRKALTARRMPLPGKKAGEEAEFAFDYSAPTRVMELPSLGSRGMLADETSDWVPITPRVL